MREPRAGESRAGGTEPPAGAAGEPTPAPRDSDSPRFSALDFQRRPLPEMLARAESHAREMARRRSVRQFSRESVPRELIENAIRVAGSAPSGAHQQPWTWVVVTDPDLKARIREAAEREEQEFYRDRAPREWLDALAPLGTDFVKTHITDAPCVVVLFRRLHEIDSTGRRRTLYYTQESCGLAAGFFITAIHLAGLATLTHTPSPMGFLRELLGRPENEKPFLLMPVGYPVDDARVPDLERRSLEEISVWL
jgi:iodotyrosine deiodinase